MAESLFYGPAAGAAGVAVKITDSSPQVRQGPLGIYCVVAPFAKGDSSLVPRVLDSSQARQVIGRVLTTDYGGISCLAFLDRARGAGNLHVARVTAEHATASVPADETKGELRLWSREVMGNTTTLEPILAAISERTIAMSAIASTKGEWSGPLFQYAGFADDSTISGRTIRLDTDQNSVFRADELVGRKFKIGSFATEFVIQANEATHASGPMLTLDQGFSGYTAAAGAVFVRIYDRAEDADGNLMACSVAVKDDPIRVTSRVALDVKVDGAPVASFGDVDLNDLAALDEDIVDAVGYEGADFDANDQTVADATVPEARPCNWAGLVKPLTDVAVTELDDLGSVLSTNNEIQLSILETVLQTANAGNVPLFTSMPAIPTTCIPHFYTITFTGAATFTVTVTDPYTGEEIVQAADMPAGATGADYPGTGLPHSDLVTFRLTADAGIVSGAVLKLYVWALPSNLRSMKGVFKPAVTTTTGHAAVTTDAGANVARPSVFREHGIIDNGPDWVKVALGGALGVDLASVAQPARPPVARGTDASNSHDTTGGALTLKYHIEEPSDGSTVTHTVPDNGVRTTAQLAADLQTLENAGTPRLTYAADSTNRLVCWLKDGTAGADIVLAVEDGTLNTTLGLDDDTDHAGKDGAVAMISYDQPLRSAKQEHKDVAVGDIVDLLSTDPAGTLRNWVVSQPGLVTILIPGQTDPTVIQQAIDFAEATGCFVRFDLPSTGVDTELGAVDWLQANITPKRFHSQSFPSWGRTSRSPRTATGRETVPLSGALSGAEAAWINSPEEGRGWHKATAGTHLLLSPYIGPLVRDTADLAGNPLNRVRDDLLNPAGIVAVRRSGPSVFAWGDEGPNKLFNGTYWLHKQRSILHVAALLRANHDTFLFHAQSPSLRRDLILSVRSLLEPLHENGWFKTLETGLPPTFENSVAIQCDETNNPNPETGKLICSIKAYVVDTTKLIEFNIGTSGVSVAGSL